jgi:hypothetical protein
LAQKREWWPSTREERPAPPLTTPNFGENIVLSVTWIRYQNERSHSVMLWIFLQTLVRRSRDSIPEGCSDRRWHFELHVAHPWRANIDADSPEGRHHCDWDPQPKRPSKWFIHTKNHCHCISWRYCMKGRSSRLFYGGSLSHFIRKRHLMWCNRAGNSCAPQQTILRDIHQAPVSSGRHALFKSFQFGIWFLLRLKRHRWVLNCLHRFSSK